MRPRRVQEIVAHLGLAPDRLAPNQIEFLRLPLHLALLAGVIRGDEGRPLDFDSPKDLYDSFWRRKRADLLPVLGDANAFETLICALSGAINDRQALSVPRGLLPPGDADLDRLVSANVLVRQGSRIGYFHEGFFDYDNDNGHLMYLHNLFLNLDSAVEPRRTRRARRTSMRCECFSLHPTGEASISETRFNYSVFLRVSSRSSW